MSTGCVPLLKAAPEPDQIADRLDGGLWRGLELCLAAKHVASDAAIEQAARVAAEIGSPVLTIHLFVPLSPEEFRAAGAVDAHAVEGFLRYYADACTSRGVTPLIENVPPILRMRTGGVFLSQIGGHWRDLLEWRERIPELGFTLDTSHAALFRSFAASYPALFGL